MCACLYINCTYNDKPKILKEKRWFDWTTTQNQQFLVLINFTVYHEFRYFYNPSYLIIQGNMFPVRIDILLKFLKFQTFLSLNLICSKLDLNSCTFKSIRSAFRLLKIWEFCPSPLIPLVDILACQTIH